jgi:exopolyphosphatase/guanosine-5'-triphosphate,3'-diphosphate pyrophosphatase
VGVHISYERHHKHSYYLIKNGDLRGFEPNEIETIALVARYHRRARPSKQHEGYSDLGRKRRQTVRELAAILRLAESLDRSHAQTISSLDLHDRGDDALLQARTSGDAELELWAASRHAAPFERLIGKPLRVEAGRDSYAEHGERAPRLPRKAVRRRRDRRVGQGTARHAGQAADGRPAQSGRQGIKLVRTRQSNDHDRQEERADAGDAQPAARHGLR